MALGYCFGQHRYRVFPIQKFLLDSTALECQGPIICSQDRLVNQNTKACFILLFKEVVKDRNAVSCFI